MRRAKSLHSILLLSASLAAAVFAAACSGHPEGTGDRAVWFVHATDPHLYLYLKKPNDPNEKATWDFQQKQDAETFRTFLRTVATLPQEDGPPAFLLITGDFGVDPCLNLKAATPPTTPVEAKDCLAPAVDEKERASRVDALAELLSASPVPDIYIVAGNNDLPFETADDAGLGYFNQFFQDVQTRITARNANVRLHNLTGCYAPNGGAIANCSPDIPGTPYRIIGFPSQSFKNKDTKYASNQALQSAQYKTFRGFFDQAAKDGKKVLIATHIPEMDDPYFLAQDRYAGVKPNLNSDTDKDNPRSAYSAWNVEKSLLDDWARVLASDSLVAVLAGHLHDSHKEIYRQPYSWSTLKEHQLGYRKLFLAPPLSVKNQDGSPIQARGFSVVLLKDDHLTNRFYWFDGKNSTFASDTSLESEHPKERHRWWLARLWHWITGLFSWFWRLGDVVPPIEHTAILLIALLTAFLTVVALWQIPPSDDPLGQKSVGAGATAPSPAPDSSPFTSRFGKTILAGLGGFVLADVTKTLGSQQNVSPETKDAWAWYYLNCFIFFFFVMLFGLNFMRALVEALRTRVAVIHYTPARLRTQSWISYWWFRVVRWLLSLRVPFLTFFDTFIDLIQGKNQTKTKAFGEALIEQQLNVIRVATVIRKKLTRLVREKLGEGDKPQVRVNISVLSADQSSVFYISRSSGSPFISFPKNSMAWVSVFTGKIRWYESFYKGQDIVLFDNRDGDIVGSPNQLMLADYYQQRHDDYQAFVIVPVPRPQRGSGSNYVKGAIHISFDKNEYFAKIWPNPAVHFIPQSPAAVPAAPVPPAGGQRPTVAAGPFSYPEPEHMLDDWCPDPHIQMALNDAVAVLGELLNGFNETVFTQIPPDKRD